MKLLYFARLRELLARDTETVALPDGVATVAELVGWLRGRPGGFADAFADVSWLRIAVNQSFADLETRLSPDDEVAFFPPMTGG